MTDLARIPLPADPVEAVEPVGLAEKAAYDYITTAVDALSKLVDLNSDDIEGLARANLLATRFKRQFDLLIEQIRPYLIACMGKEKQIDLDGIGRLQRKTGVRHSKWNHEDIRRDVRREAMRRCITEDGEILPMEVAVTSVLDLVFGVVSQGSYKTTGLRELLGIEPDEVSETTWGDQTVVIVGAAQQ